MAHGRALHRYLARRLGDSELARDALQDVYLRLIQGDRDVRYAQAYAFRVASNVVYELYQRALRDPIVYNSDADGVVMPDESPETESELQWMLSRLPPLWAAIVLLRKRDELSYREIAQKLAISVHTVKKYLRLALARCRQQRT